jgi:hypothetical protein
VLRHPPLPVVLLHQREMGGDFAFEIAVGAGVPEKRDGTGDESPHRRGQSHRLH